MAHIGNAKDNNSTAKQGFFGSLESLRGVAALLVVLYHLPPWFVPIYDVQVIRHGYLMVNFFFVLSGFVMFHSYRDRIRTGASLFRFAVLRLGRLYPVHILFVVPFLAIELAKYQAFVNGMTNMNSQPSLAKIGHSLLANIFLVQGLGFTSNDPALNFPNWSISTEFYTYLIFGCAVLILSGRRFIVMSIALVAMCLAIVITFPVRVGEVGNMLRCLAGFFTGCLTRAVFELVRHKRVSFDWPIVVALISVIGLGLRWRSPTYCCTWYEQLSLPAASVLILSLLLTPGSKLNAFLLSSPLRWLGEISYSLYMVHALVQWCARQACRKILRTTEVSIDGISASPLSLHAAIVVYPTVMLITLVAGWLTFRFIEAPCRDLARRRITAWLPERA